MRGSGILLSISSLPSKYGIGTIGKQAYEFIDFLNKSGQTYWQILPIGPTTIGDSPYQCFSTFAGNPYFIDLDLLNQEGLLISTDYCELFWGKDQEQVDYRIIYEQRFDILKIAFKNFKQKEEREKKLFQDFKIIEKEWLDDYALFMSIKQKYEDQSWQNWNIKLKKRDKYTLKRKAEELKEEIEFWCFVQFKFYQQWFALKSYANQKNIKIIGDIPIYVALDSADVWTNPEVFDLNADMQPIHVAGCPPDAFSKTGQLWGNPLYLWDEMKKNDYEWWLRRIQQAMRIYDVTRIDHFRGFDSYYSIKAGELTAEYGTWEKGPGMDLFYIVEKKLGKLEIIAEDLGFLTPSVKKLLENSGFPGMKILEFAFDSREGGDYLPHNYNKNCVVYTGTHDNSTIMGWLKEASAESIEYCKEYFDINQDKDFAWKMIVRAMATVCDLTIIPMQDYLQLDDKARMNIPSTCSGNWQWRMKRTALTKKLENWIYYITSLYQRTIRKAESMKTYIIKLNSIENIKQFVNTISKCENNCDLVSGKYIVDAKSILGIFSLDLEKNLKLHIYGHNLDQIEETIKPYLVE